MTGSDRNMPKVLLIINQVYVPDPASVGQYMHDAAAEMVRRGWRVQVLTSARGYGDPSVRYEETEVIDGVEVRRLGLSSFGKSSMGARLAGAFGFLLQATLHGVFRPKIDLVLVSTVPPMCSIAGVLIGMIRNVPFKFWVMDINPDQAVVLGKAERDSVPVKVFEYLNRIALKRSRGVITLDSFMEARLRRKHDAARIDVIPPWPHTECADESLPRATNAFRSQLELQDKFVVMYSGNISPVHPIVTILEAAKALQKHRKLVFLFAGGGLGMKDVDEYVRKNRISNVRTLPYQPLAALRQFLSVADVHLVSLGNEMVGIVHPSKIYSAMAVARPILFLGPKPCHLSDILERFDVGWRVDHGDVRKAVEIIEGAMNTDPEELKRKGRNAREAVSKQFSRACLRGRLCDALER